jgi:hypothetical protein
MVLEEGWCYKFQNCDIIRKKNKDVWPLVPTKGLISLCNEDSARTNQQGNLIH